MVQTQSNRLARYPRDATCSECNRCDAHRSCRGRCPDGRRPADADGGAGDGPGPHALEAVRREGEALRGLASVVRSVMAQAGKDYDMRLPEEIGTALKMKALEAAGDDIIVVEDELGGVKRRIPRASVPWHQVVYGHGVPTADRSSTAWGGSVDVEIVPGLSICQARERQQDELRQSELDHVPPEQNQYDWEFRSEGRSEKYEDVEYEPYQPRVPEEVFVGRYEEIESGNVDGVEVVVLPGDLGRGACGGVGHLLLAMDDLSFTTATVDPGITFPCDALCSGEGKLLVAVATGPTVVRRLSDLFLYPWHRCHRSSWMRNGVIARSVLKAFLLMVLSGCVTVKRGTGVEASDDTITVFPDCALPYHESYPVPPGWSVVSVQPDNYWGRVGSDGGGLDSPAHLTDKLILPPELRGATYGKVPKRLSHLRTASGTLRSLHGKDVCRVAVLDVGGIPVPVSVSQADLAEASGPLVVSPTLLEPGAREVVVGVDACATLCCGSPSGDEVSLDPPRSEVARLQGAFHPTRSLMQRCRTTISPAFWREGFRADVNCIARDSGMTVAETVQCLALMKTLPTLAGSGGCYADVYLRRRPRSGGGMVLSDVTPEDLHELVRYTGGKYFLTLNQREVFLRHGHLSRSPPAHGLRDGPDSRHGVGASEIAYARGVCGVRYARSLQ